MISSAEKSNFRTLTFKYLIYELYLLLVTGIQINWTGKNCRCTSVGTNLGAGNENEHGIHVFIFVEHQIVTPSHKWVSLKEDWAWDTGAKAGKTRRHEVVHDSEVFG